MAKRKTISLNTLTAMANVMFKDSAPDYRAQREGVANLLSSALMEAGNYHGFRYLDETEVSSDSMPGIRPGEYDYNHNQRFLNTDNTRVHYF
jgi:hypothetical protein